MPSEFAKFLELARPNLERNCYAAISALLYRTSDTAPSWQGASVRIVLQPFAEVRGSVVMLRPMDGAGPNRRCRHRDRLVTYHGQQGRGR